MIFDKDTTKIHNLLHNLDAFISGEDCELYTNSIVHSMSSLRQKNINIIRMYLGNSFFTLKEMMMYAAHGSLFDSDFHKKINSWDFKHIRDVVSIYSKEHLENDMKLIKEIESSVKLGSAEKYLTINSLGEMIALELTKQKVITPNFVIRYHEKFNFKNPPNSETIRMIRVVYALHDIKNTDKIK